MKFLSDINLLSSKIIGAVIDPPVNDTDIANKAYVDSVSGGNLVNGLGGFTQDIGDGSNTVYTINHNLNTTDLVVSVYEVATGSVVNTDMVATDANNLTLTFASAPATDAYRAVIIGPPNTALGGSGGGAIANVTSSGSAPANPPTVDPATDSQLDIHFAVVAGEYSSTVALYLGLDKTGASFSNGWVNIPSTYITW